MVIIRPQDGKVTRRGRIFSGSHRFDIESQPQPCFQKKILIRMRVAPIGRANAYGNFGLQVFYKITDSTLDTWKCAR
jgi:hypothetical protein